MKKNAAAAAADRRPFLRLRAGDIIILRSGARCTAARDHDLRGPLFANLRAVERKGLMLYPVLGATGWTLASVPE